MKNRTKTATKKLVVDALIEIPKGDDRRRHLVDTKDKIADFGPIRGRIPVNDGVMPIAYGLIMNTTNQEEKDEKRVEEVDVLIYSRNGFTVGQRLKVVPIAMLEREDGDHKVVAVEESRKDVEKWEDIPVGERELIIAYFGYNAPIKPVIRDARTASEFVRKSRSAANIEYKV